MDARVNPAEPRDAELASDGEARSDGRASVTGATSRDAAAKVRLLVPFAAGERMQWALRYALAQHRAGHPVEIHLLYVAEPVTSWEVLRFRTQAEIAAFQAERARWLLDDAIGQLRQAGIRATGHYRQGDPAFEIADAAEQLGCDRIVLPRPRPRWQALFGRDVVREVIARATRARVVTIGADGKTAA